MSKMTPEVAQLVQEILDGRLDDSLDDIATAIAVRIKESLLTYSWRFRLDALDVGELELTLGEWSKIQKATGVHLTALAPETNVDHLMGIGRVLLVTRGGLGEAEAATRMESFALPDIPNLITREMLEAPFGSGTPAST